MYLPTRGEFFEGIGAARFQGYGCAKFGKQASGCIARPSKSADGNANANPPCELPGLVLVKEHSYRPLVRDGEMGKLRQGFSIAM
jgi:hypothetical protein